MLWLLPWPVAAMHSMAACVLSIHNRWGLAQNAAAEVRLSAAAGCTDSLPACCPTQMSPGAVYRSPKHDRPQVRWCSPI